ncbi:HlyD family efflux transporter periplasmic adaptor subunit [uncultured Desulfuromonas sp.]|uniref:efflux RND transporter periplasmic adaptor subunit n=1 Tax=uncultured Desulfuromonas sp. TaxID=181013 RepID=UPI002AAC1C5A|nr:HlyD family efflux transporter periplasmic adaptor subunit [uncultured Desulfuromonas sp.]
MNEASQVTFLSGLVHLETRLRQAENVDALSYRLANETRNLVQYDQLIVWRYSKKGITLSAVSGVDRVAALSPFAHQFQHLVRDLRGEERGKNLFDLPRDAFLHCSRGDLLSDLPWQHLLWVPLTKGEATPCAGLLVFREQTGWSDQEKKLFEHLADTAQHAWKALQPGFERAPRQRRWIGWAVAAVLLAGSCFPIRLSVLAPGEVVARDMVIITAPLDGIVARVLVQPNENVTEGQPLATLDQTSLSNQLNVARQAFEVVKAQYQHARQRAFSDAEARENLLLFEAQLRQKQAELDYAKSLLAQTRITAPCDGVAVFNDVNDWLGRPVTTGERIMTVASPQSVELHVLLPVKDAIRLDPEQRAGFFLNVAPTRPLAATIERIGYETVADPVLGPVYPIKAVFSSSVTADVRIGARGTARLYGRRVALIYAILRKPLTQLRLYVGI